VDPDFSVRLAAIEHLHGVSRRSGSSSAAPPDARNHVVKAPRQAMKVLNGCETHGEIRIHGCSLASAALERNSADPEGTCNAAGALPT